MNDPRISRTELLEYLNNLEKKYSVETWTIEKLHVWPLIKIDMFFRLVSLERNGFRKAYKIKTSRVRKIGMVLKALISSYKYIRFKYCLKKNNIPYFFSDSGSHRVWYGGKFLNRYFDPIKEQIQDLRGHYSSLTINDEVTNSSIYPKDENILFIQKYIYGSKLLRIIKNKKFRFQCRGFDGFLTEVQLKFPILGLNNNYRKELNNRVQSIFATSDIVDILIEKHQPKVIFELCYYSSLRYAINYSAYKNGIPTVEIQHGGLGRDHVAYSGWGKVPPSGFNLIPKIFWAWDKNSEQIVGKWVKNNSFHKTVLGGNPWLMFSLKNESTYNFPKNKKIILYTLQDKSVDDYIYEAIENSPEDYEWWVREHPRFPMVGIIFKNELNKREMANRVVLKRAKEYPLPVLLNKCIIHLSGSSGSILEASLLGVPSLILDKAGERYYEKLILSGEAYSVHPKTASNLMELISQISNHNSDRQRLVENKSGINILEGIV